MLGRCFDRLGREWANTHQAFGRAGSMDVIGLSEEYADMSWSDPISAQEHQVSDRRTVLMDEDPKAIKEFIAMTYVCVELDPAI